MPNWMCARPVRKLMIYIYKAERLGEDVVMELCIEMSYVLSTVNWVLVMSFKLSLLFFLFLRTGSLEVKKNRVIFNNT